MNGKRAQATSTREALLRAGREVFARRGYDGASIREITRRANANLGAVTYHFGGKRHLYHEVLASYVHPPAQKIGVLVRAQGSPDLARLVAMHIAFANPRFVTREEVPEDEIAAERDILEKLPDLEGKPIVGCAQPPTPSTKPCTTLVKTLPGSTSMRIRVGGKAVYLLTLSGITDGVPPGSVMASSAGQTSTSLGGAP